MPKNDGRFGRFLAVGESARNPDQTGNVAFLVRACAEGAMAANAAAIRAEAQADLARPRIGWLVAGVVLVTRALSRPTIGRIAAAIAGVALVKGALTGHCKIYERLGSSSGEGGSRDRSSRDPVLEASEESFPASDPPAWTPVAGSVARE